MCFVEHLKDLTEVASTYSRKIAPESRAFDIPLSHQTFPFSRSFYLEMLFRGHQHLSTLVGLLLSCTYINSLPSEYSMQCRTLRGVTPHLPSQGGETAQVDLLRSSKVEKHGIGSASGSAVGDLREPLARSVNQTLQPTMAGFEKAPNHFLAIKELQEAWQEELNEGMKRIEERDPRFADRIKASEMFKAIPTAFALIVQAQITLAKRISKRSDNDWTSMENYPKYFLEDPEKFNALSHNFCMPEFPSILRAKTAREYYVFAEKLAAMNNKLSRVLLEELINDRSKIPQFLENVRKVDDFMEQYRKSVQLERDFDNYLEKISSSIRNDLAADTLTLNEIKDLQYLTSQRENEIRKLVKKNFSIHEAKYVQGAIKILKRISARSLHSEIFEVQEQVERMGLRYLTKFIGGNQVDDESWNKIDEFDFKSIQKSRKISDLDYYELKALTTQKELQHILMNLCLKPNKSQDEDNVLYQMLELGKQAKNMRLDNPNITSEFLEVLRGARGIFNDLWPLPFDFN